MVQPRVEQRGADVVVLGLGPAGRAVSHRLAARGLAVLAVDPAPDRGWTPTYAAWADELPGWLAPEAVSTRFRPQAWARASHVLAREYVVLSTPGLQQSLGLVGVRVRSGTARRVSAHHVELADGSRLTAPQVIDARGASLHPERVQQTAAGLLVDRRRAEELLDGPWLMDWRRDNGASAHEPPSFLYALPVDEDHWLLEETCLVGRPALGLRELRRRLDVRLASRGVTLSGFERVEHVRFAVEPDPGESGVGGVLAYGARGGFMHPATGYSVATALRLADVVAEAVHQGRDPSRVLWSPAARATRRLRQAGLRTLLSLSADGTTAFFEAFFGLPTELQRGYLSERDNPAATLRAMATMARHLPPTLTATAVRSTAAELLPLPARPVPSSTPRP